MVRSDRWPLYRTSALSPDTRSRTVDCSRGGGEKCRDEASVPSLGEVVSRKRNSVVADLLPDARLYDTGGHTRRLTQPSGCVGADSVAEHTQLTKWQTSHRDSQCEPLDDIEKSLGVLSSRGDDIAHFALSTLGTHLSDTTPNLPSITQDPLTRRQAMLTPQADEWRAAEARELESLVKKGVYVVCELPRGRRLVGA